MQIYNFFQSQWYKFMTFFDDARIQGFQKRLSNRRKSVPISIQHKYKSAQTLTLICF